MLASPLSSFKNMPIPIIPGLKEPKNLTGRVTVDKTKEIFFGNYSRVYQGRYRKELVSGSQLIRDLKSLLISRTKGSSEGNSGEGEGRIHEESTRSSINVRMLGILTWLQ